jgi:pilus assembly protein CpaE
VRELIFARKFTFGMASMTSILIVDDSDMMLKLISAALKQDGYQLYTAQSGKQALETAARFSIDLALLDVVLPDMDGYEICKQLRKDPRTARIPIIMLTSLTDLDNRLNAFDAGADDFMQKPFQLEELQVRVKAQLRRASSYLAPPAETDIKIQKLAVFSLRGGVGISTLAVNLAVGFAQLWGEPTLLADMSFLNGQDALMMDIALRNTWADLGNLPPEEIDSEMLEKVVLHHSSGVDVLAAPRRCADAELMTEKHVHSVFQLAEKRYKFQVMDLPHDFSFTTIAGLDLADTILLVSAPDLASIRCASGALNVFKDLGYPDEKVQLVLNWNFNTSGLARKEIEKTLRKPISVVIPNMPDSLVTAITLGKPIILESEKPEAALFEDLAYFWTIADYKKKEPATPSAMWLRVIDRSKRRLQQSKQ